jgi:hypothetical protein
VRLASQHRLQLLATDSRAGRQAFDAAVTRDVDKHPARENRRIGAHVAPARPKIAQMLRSAEAVVPVGIGTERDVRESVDVAAGVHRAGHEFAVEALTVAVRAVGKIVACQHESA